MKATITAVAALAVALCTYSFLIKTVESKDSVATILEFFGDEPSPNRPKLDMAYVSVERGRDIVNLGVSAFNEHKSKRQSKHFTCISCHTTEREDPDLTDPNPEARLKFVAEKNIPFLQGSTFFGVVNRTHFYNGDYKQKYGALVEPARENIREAIQLCAVECSQGRKLEPNELESVLAYLWTLEYKLSDLSLSDDEMDLIQYAYQTGRDKSDAIDIIKAKYLDHSPATFAKPLTGRDSLMQSLEGNVESGRLLYNLSCQYCHFHNNHSYLLLDDQPLTFRYLAKHFDDYKEHSLGQVVRYGTQPKGGKKAYMPLYPLEKMSNQQLKDLRAYISLKAS